MYEERLKQAIFGNGVTCKKCLQKVNVISNASLEDISNFVNPSVEDIFLKLVENSIEKHECQSNCQNPELESDKNEKMIVMTFEVPNEIRIPNEILI